MCHFFVLATFWRHLWSITVQTHGSMESNVFVNYKMWPLAQKCTLTVSIGIAKNCSLAFCHRFVICLWLMGCHSKRLGHPVQTAATICLKNSSSVLMVEVICLEKIFMHSKGWAYLFKKAAIQTAECYLFKWNCSGSNHNKQTNKKQNK